MCKSKGFVTIATGNDSFIKLAIHLKQSYDFQGQSIKYPWAIITDKENKLLNIFDRIIILKDATQSYLDKIKMLSIPPWDENIFIDADCLIYGDISFLFSVFPFKGVKHIGYKKELSEKGGWFEINDIGDYKNQISFKIHSHGGIIFFNNDSITHEIFKTSLDISNHWYDYKFYQFKKPADEPIIALSMCIHNCEPIPWQLEKIICFYRVQKMIQQINICKGLLTYKNKWNNRICENVPVMHWGNEETKKYLYKSEIIRLYHLKYYSIRKYYWKVVDLYNELLYYLKTKIVSTLNLI